MVNILALVLATYSRQIFGMSTIGSRSSRPCVSSLIKRISLDNIKCIFIINLFGYINGNNISKSLVKFLKIKLN
jgi:hypothetical protein